MFAYKYNEKFYFYKKVLCQIDPLESKKAGKDIFLLPANSTFIEPPEQKEGFFIKWNGESWEYEKQPEIKKWTENEMRIFQLKELLSGADYWGQKYIDGEYTAAEWEEKKAQRKAWREEIRQLEGDE